MRISVLLCLPLLMLAGCMRQPLRHADDLLFSSPMLTQTQKLDDIWLGLKCLSEPEMHELFCSPHALTRSFHVLYLRVNNRSDNAQTLTISGGPIAQKHEITDYFSPDNTATMVAQSILGISLALGLRFIIPDDGVYMLSLIASTFGLGFLFDLVAGSDGYKKLASKVVVFDKRKGGALLCAQPHALSHHLIFMHRRLLAPQDIVCSVAQKGRVTREVKFGFKGLVGL